MRYRTLGRTGLKVSEIGFGAWGIGQSQWVGAEDETSLRALKTAQAAGINFYDTALAYGMGHSEQLLARAFGNSADVIIASKVPPKNFVWPAQAGTPLAKVFPKQYVLDCLNTSLKNLGRESADLYQFHVWSDEWARQDEWHDTVRRMRDSGKARFVGISINDHQPSNVLKALDTGLIDAVQVIYNIFDQSPDDELLPYCQQHNIGVLARVPFDEGSLTGKIKPDTTFPQGDFRNAYFTPDYKREAWKRVEGIVRDTGTSLEQLPKLALRYCLSHAAVSTVIPGMRTPERVAPNVEALDAGPLPGDLLRKLQPYRWIG